MEWLMENGLPAQGTYPPFSVLKTQSRDNDFLGSYDGKDYYANRVGLSLDKERDKDFRFCDIVRYSPNNGEYSLAARFQKAGKAADGTPTTWNAYYGKIPLEKSEHQDAQTAFRALKQAEDLVRANPDAL